MDQRTAATEDVDFVALCDYLPNHRNQIEVYQGDLLVLVGFVQDSDWLVMLNLRTAERGFVPGQVVEPYDYSPYGAGTACLSLSLRCNFLFLFAL